MSTFTIGYKYHPIKLLSLLTCVCFPTLIYNKTNIFAFRHIVYFSFFPFRFIFFQFASQYWTCRSFTIALLCVNKSLRSQFVHFSLLKLSTFSFKIVFFIISLSMHRLLPLSIIQWDITHITDTYMYYTPVTPKLAFNL